MMVPLHLCALPLAPYLDAGCRISASAKPWPDSFEPAPTTSMIDGTHEAAWGCVNLPLRGSHPHYFQNSFAVTSSKYDGTGSPGGRNAYFSCWCWGGVVTMPYHLSRALGRDGNRVTLLTSRRKRGQCIKATLQEGTEGEAVDWVQGLLERRVQRYDLDFLGSSSLQGGMNLTHTGH